MDFIDFIEERFPEDISYGSSGGPEYFTDVITTSNGYEQRNINWSQARYRYNIAPGIKKQEQMEKIISFFHICRGRALGFRFKDWSDYKARGENLGLVTGTKKIFQLSKEYHISKDIKIKRLINKPVKDSVKVYIDGDLDKDLEIDHLNGRISFYKVPNSEAKITADFDFDVPVRFDLDYLPISIEGGGVYSFANIPLIEMKRLQ